MHVPTEIVRSMRRSPINMAPLQTTNAVSYTHLDVYKRQVGACVGMRGSRVQAVVNELQGEKIDIIPWNAEQATFLVNALQPAEVSKVCRLYTAFCADKGTNCTRSA